jgi:hypothetical protein
MFFLIFLDQLVKRVFWNFNRIKLKFLILERIGLHIST